MTRLMFWEHFEKTPDCWPWTGRVDREGYGRVWARGESLAHRLSWKLHVGPIPDGLTLDHLCRNRRCVNPAHLEPVTMGENGRRGNGASAINARKTHCKHGHAFDAANTYVYWRANSEQRSCRACAVRINRDARARRRSSEPPQP